MPAPAPNTTGKPPSHFRLYFTREMKKKVVSKEKTSTLRLVTKTTWWKRLEGAIQAGGGGY